MELTQENFDRLMKEVTSLKEETTNKTKALDSEREKRKSYESTLSEQTEKERLKKEERLRKEGKTEQLLEEYQSKVKLLNDKLSDLEPKVNEYESFKANQKSKIVTELEELKKNINPSILEGYSDVISGLGEEHQMAFLRRISEDVKTPDFGNKPESKGTVETSGFNVLTVSQYEKLPTSQRKEYMQRSTEETGEVKLNKDI